MLFDNGLNAPPWHNPLLQQLPHVVVSFNKGESQKCYVILPPVLVLVLVGETTVYLL